MLYLSLQHWLDNKDSMVALLSKSHMGVKGLVVNSIGWGVAGATVTVEGIDKNVTSSGRGEYWRLLVPGYNYTLVKSVVFQSALLIVFFHADSFSSRVCPVPACHSVCG